MKRHYEQIHTTYKRIKIERLDLKRKNMFEDNNNINKKIKLDDNEIYVRWKRDIIMYS
jgi:hypothetical protein